ncbi:MAG: class I SAM-dependent methyltransferase [Caldilineaceae bacterium]|nr:class I SAM-dependent methyltransferase [Caldilineaceae bacterium]
MHKTHQPIDSEAFLQDQIAYYRARAGEYDEWFLRQGRYDRDARENERWFADVAHLRRALDDFAPTGNVLELACGTGLWTEQLLCHATRITAVDASPEVLALNQQRLQSDRVAYVQADLFQWQPTERYDVVFFSFWLSHVPAQRFARFWQTVAHALHDNGRVFFIDSRHVESSTAKDHQLAPIESQIQERRLNDGRTYQIVKIFYEPTELHAALSQLGWQSTIQRTATYFLYGSALRK